MIVILSRGECPKTMLSPVVYNIQWQCHRIEQSPVVICPVTYRRMMDNNNYPLDGVWCEVKYPTMTIWNKQLCIIMWQRPLISKTCCSALRHYEFCIRTQRHQQWRSQKSIRISCRYSNSYTSLFRNEYKTINPGSVVVQLPRNRCYATITTIGKVSLSCGNSN